ncbi:hypothetical protein Tco_1306406 [Tanacetum coccineum]
MEAVVEQYSVDKTNFEIQIKQLRIDNDQLLNQIMSQEIVNIAMNSSVENPDLKAQLQEKVFATTALKNELRKLKGKNVLNIVVSKPLTTTLAPGMYKLDLEQLSPKLLNNKEAHIDYIKYTQE